MTPRSQGEEEYYQALKDFKEAMTVVIDRMINNANRNYKEANQLKDVLEKIK